MVLNKLCRYSLSATLVAAAVAFSTPVKAISLNHQYLDKVLQVLGLSGFSVEDLKGILGDENVDWGVLNDLLGGANAPSNNGIYDPLKTISISDVFIGGRGTLDWSKIFTDPVFEHNAFKLANGSIDLSASKGNFGLPIDYIKINQLSQILQSDAAARNKQNQENHKATDSIFQDTAKVYADIQSTPPNSSLEAIEQSNKIAIANGLVQMSQTRQIQALVKSQESLNAASNASLERERVNNFRQDVSASQVDTNSKKSRDLWFLNYNP